MAKVQGKTLTLIFLGLVLAVAAVIFWIGATGGSQHVPGSKPGVGFGDPKATSTVSSAAPTPELAFERGAIERTVKDRRVRDELRRRILAAWAAGTDEVAAAARKGTILPAPTAPDGGAMDPAYIREVVRGEFLPMATKCYEELLSRRDAAAGRLEMKFTIVAEENLGGLVEDVDVVSDGGVADTGMTTCMRESMLGIAFRPPAHGGTVTVTYPIEFAPDEPDH